MPKPAVPPDLDVVFATIRALGAELERERRRREVAERGRRLAEAEVEKLTAWIATHAQRPPSR